MNAYEQACEEWELYDIAWRVEAMRNRERRRRTDEADGWFEPIDERED